MRLIIRGHKGLTIREGPKDLLLKSSGKIARICKDNGNYSYVGTDDENLEVVCDYLYYLKSQSIKNENSMATGCKYKRFCALYGFCKRFEDADSATRVFKSFMRVYKESQKTLPDADVVKDIYKCTFGGDVMRKFVIECYMETASDDDFKKENRLPLEFTIDITSYPKASQELTWEEIITPQNYKKGLE